ncbi:MAG: hypothetical protein J6O55_01765 [Lachnospiraceae bacterium]|nr:hypothetical protein [Lachnospiraceae bacterium]
MPAANVGFKHSLRLQLNDCRELLLYAEEIPGESEAKERLIKKLHTMIDTLETSLKD